MTAHRTRLVRREAVAEGTMAFHFGRPREFLFQAGRVLGDSAWTAHAYRYAARIVERIAVNQPACGTPSNIESPGLMIGLVGIGYGLLRLAEPEHVPSVLMLEPPLKS